MNTAFDVTGTPMSVGSRALTQKKTLLEKFKKYHQDNPHIFQELWAIAKSVRDAGANRVGIEFVVHRLRWLSNIEKVQTNCEYAFDERYKTFYARLLMMADPDLEGLFRTKKTRAWSGQRSDLLDCSMKSDI